MKITIIGAGSIGGAIARGLCSNICCRERTSQHQAGNNKFLHLLFSIILAIIHFDANVRVLFLFSILLQLMILQL